MTTYLSKGKMVLLSIAAKQVLALGPIHTICIGELYPMHRQGNLPYILSSFRSCQHSVLVCAEKKKYLLHIYALHYTTSQHAEVLRNENLIL